VAGVVSSAGGLLFDQIFNRLGDGGLEVEELGQVWVIVITISS
jgi:hypothetical protein